MGAQHRDGVTPRASLVAATGPNFALPIRPDGYAWWYIDASSDCGQHGLTLIVMLGCVFSPWYARARRRGPTDPLDHAAINLALYGRSKRWWTMTERDRHAVTRQVHQLQIGPSELRWQGDTLHISINEKTAPWPRAVHGEIRLKTSQLLTHAWAIDAEGAHRWTPIAPHAQIEVDFERPHLRWAGPAYFDGNEGDAPLERDFARWQWARAHEGNDSVIFYDTQWLHGGGRSLALRILADGSTHTIEAANERLPLQRLPSTPWGIKRDTHCDKEQQSRVIKTLEDGPFYARSLLETRIDGRAVQAWHESVSLERFRSRWVQALLPVRLPRSTKR